MNREILLAVNQKDGLSKRKRWIWLFQGNIIDPASARQRPLLYLLVDSCVFLPMEQFQLRLEGLDLAAYAAVLVCIRSNFTLVSSS